MKRKAVAGIATIGVLGVATLTIGILVVTSSPGSITTHGMLESCVPNVDDSSQITVLDSANHVIATGSLTADTSKSMQQLETQYAKMSILTGQLGGDSTGMTVYDFTVTVPGGESRYGLSVGSNHGTVWESPANMRNKPQLNIGC